MPDGLLLRRSRTAVVRGLGRRPLMGGASPYIQFPSTSCKVVDCPGRIDPEFTFTSSRPDVADFVARDLRTSDERVPAKGPDGRPMSDPTSALLCAFNAGSTTITIRAGGDRLQPAAHGAGRRGRAAVWHAGVVDACGAPAAERHGSGRWAVPRAGWRGTADGRRSDLAADPAAGRSGCAVAGHATVGAGGAERVHPGGRCRVDRAARAAAASDHRASAAAASAGWRHDHAARAAGRGEARGGGGLREPVRLRPLPRPRDIAHPRERRPAPRTHPHRRRRWRHGRERAPPTQAAHGHGPRAHDAAAAAAAPPPLGAPGRAEGGRRGSDGAAATNKPPARTTHARAQAAGGNKPPARTSTDDNVGWPDDNYWRPTSPRHANTQPHDNLGWPDDNSWRPTSPRRPLGDEGGPA